jgi:hypothetical protein
MRCLSLVYTSIGQNPPQTASHPHFGKARDESYAVSGAEGRASPPRLFWTAPDGDH